MCRVGCPKIHCVSRSARTLSSLLSEKDSIQIYGSPQRPSETRPHPNQIRHSLGEALLSMNTSPLNEKLILRPDQERRQGQADAALPHLPEWNEYLLRLVEKGKSPAGNWTVTLLNHYMTEKSILVMIDPRPTIVPGEPGLLSLPS